MVNLVSVLLINLEGANVGHAAEARVPTVEQTSAGGVAFRRKGRTHEVAEARWFGLDEAAAVLAFKSERDVLSKARALLLGVR